MWHFPTKKNEMPSIGDFTKSECGSTLKGIQSVKYLQHLSEKCHGCDGKGWVVVIANAQKCPVCAGSGVKPYTFSYHQPIVVDKPSQSYSAPVDPKAKFPGYETDFKENENG